jgi:hypothetical protein
MSDLYEQAYFAQLSDYCAQVGLNFSGHILLEDDLPLHVMFEGNFFSLLRHMHTPGIDMLWSTPEKLWQYAFTPLLVRSIADVYGRGHVMDEVATRQMTVLVSSHNLRELADICDHVGIMQEGRMCLERSLEDLQGGFVKVQVAFAQEGDVIPQGLDVIHRERQGRLHTLVVRGAADAVEDLLNQQGATFVNVLPLSLEEIFIYEIGGAQHEER